MRLRRNDITYRNPEPDNRTPLQFERDECSGWARWLGTVAIPIVLLGLWVASPALGHSWYDAICCSDQDCRPMEPGAVEWTPGGYLIHESGELIPEDSYVVRDSQDGRYHRCSLHYRAPQVPNETRCLYVPRMGV